MAIAIVTGKALVRTKVRVPVMRYIRTHHHHHWVKKWTFRWVLRPAYKVQLRYVLNGRMHVVTAYPRHDGRFTVTLRIPPKGVLTQVRVFPERQSPRSLPAQPLFVRPGVQYDNIITPGYYMR